MTRCFLLLTLFASAALADDEDERRWSADDIEQTLSTTLEVRLDPSLEGLTDKEREALDHLLDAGRIMHELYLRQRHGDISAARASIAGNSDLQTLFYLFKGPYGTTPDNERVPLVDMGPELPGKTLYPALSREALEAILADSGELRAAALGLRSVVRLATAENIGADLETLERHPAIDGLHNGLRERLETLDPETDRIYVIPYALAFADALVDARQQLLAAASLLADESPDFAAYLRLRATDLLTGNYEGGDAAWVTGAFNGLNLQLGSYETYDDALFGVKAFYGASVLARDVARSEALSAAISDLQAIEDSLPYTGGRRVRSDIPVGVYNVVADFGQARGANTATILPNQADHARKYGRTILIRNNILTNPAIFATRKRRFEAVVADEHAGDLTIDGGFERTLWHEIGHYLGVSKTADGRDLDIALGRHAALLEEMKADLVSLYAAPALLDNGYYDATAQRAHYADGIRRTLQDAKPRAEQPYQNMQLMQFNFFMEFGLIEPDLDSGLLKIHYDRYHRIVSDLLERVLLTQFAGDEAAAGEFVRRWNYWDDKLHGRLADMIRDASDYRRTLVRYAALEDREAGR